MRKSRLVVGKTFVRAPHPLQQQLPLQQQRRLQLQPQQLQPQQLWRVTAVTVKQPKSYNLGTQLN